MGLKKRWQLRHPRTRRQQDGNNGTSSASELPEKRIDLATLPGPDPTVANKDGSGWDSLDFLLQHLLPSEPRTHGFLI
jgi:hypothetical protein